MINPSERLDKTPLQIGLEVRALVSGMSRGDKSFVHGLPFSSEVARTIETERRCQHGEVITRQRIAIGSCVFGEDGQILGYQSSTIMTNASPTQDEQRNLQITGCLNLVHLKLIVVSSDFRGRQNGVSDKLLDYSLQLATDRELPWVTDVMVENIRMRKFLERNGIGEQFIWTTGKGTSMIRLGQ